MKLKLDSFYFGVLINGLHSQRMQYDDETNIIIDTLLLRLVDESNKLKPNRKKKFCFESVEVSAIRKCLLDWRNEQLKAEKEAAVEVIGELLAMVL